MTSATLIDPPEFRNSTLERTFSVKASSETVKRCFDLALVLLAVPLWVPLIVIIACMIKLTSRGPIFFSQERIGKNLSRIKIIKFRTMVVDAKERLEDLMKDPGIRAEWEQHHKLTNDPRITSIGSFLRRSSLDELPQLLNVLVGDISLVGPRPLPEYHMQSLPRLFVVARQSVKPGLTGLWQINGRDGAADLLMTYDGMYLEKRSVWLDFSLLVRTMNAVVTQRGAR